MSDERRSPSWLSRQWDASSHAERIVLTVTFVWCTSVYVHTGWGLFAGGALALVWVAVVALAWGVVARAADRRRRRQGGSAT
jgi:hypothetical protein